MYTGQPRRQPQRSSAAAAAGAALPNPGTEPLQLASNQDMAVVDDSDAVSRFEAALAAHRRLNAREDALADAQRAALERAESHDLAPPTPPVQASELQQLLDEFEAHAPAEETKTAAPPPKVTKGSGGGVYGRAARRNANQGTSRDEYGDPGPALEAISDAAATAARVTGDGLELAAKGVAVAAGATVAVVVGAAAATGAAAVEGAKVAGPAIRDAANATAEITSDAVEAAGPILQDAADATVEAAGRAADVAGPVIRDAADATVEYAGKAADAAGPVLRDAAEATSQAASAAVEQMQEIDWGDVDPGCSYNCGILEDTDLKGLGDMLGGAAAPAPPEADAAPADDAPADDVPKGPTIDDVAALVQASLDETSAAALRVTAKDAASPTTTSPGDDIAFDGDADPADLPEKPKPKRRKSKKKKKADGDAASPKSPKLKRKGSRRKKKADAAAAEARAAEAEARVAEQAAEREAMASRIAELEKSVEDLSAPAPDPPAADEKPVCGCVIA